MNEQLASIEQTFANIGSILKKSREENSYTLEQVAEITRIGTMVLRNIEEAKIEELPAPVFVKGFVSNYAKLLGLDSDWMLQEIDKCFSPEDQQKQNQVYEDEILNEKEKNPYILPTVLVALVIGGIIGGFFYTQSDGFRFGKEPQDVLESIASEETTPLTQTEPDSATPSDEEIPLIADEPADQDLASSTTTPVENESPVGTEVVDSENENETPSTEESMVVGTEKIVEATQAEEVEVPKKEEPAITISPLTLLLKGREQSWIRLKVDKGNSFDLRLEKDREYKWPGDKEYQLFMTRGSSALIYLNGEEIEVPGENFDQFYEVRLNKFSLTKLNN